MSTELTTKKPNPFTLTSFDQVKEMAGYIAEAGMYGIKKPAQAITLMMMAHEEGVGIVQLMRRVHVFEDGKISQRADYTQAEFEKIGTIVWHLRTDEACYATFFLKKDVTEEDISRGAERCELLRQLEDLKWINPREATKERKVETAISKLARSGEDSVIRTIIDADARGISQGSKGTKTNWATSPRSMLQWRCVTEGVKVVAPIVLSGMSSDVELQDARVIEQREAARIINQPKLADKDAMLEMISEYDSQLEDAKGGHRQSILGARSELVAKLHDLGVKVESTQDPAPTVGGQPAKTVEVVEVQTVVETPKKERAAKPKPAPVEAVTQPVTTEPDAPFVWQEVVNTDLGFQGQPSAGLLNLTMAEIFKPARSEKFATATLSFFKKHLGSLTAPNPHDAKVWKAAQLGYAAWQEAQATASTAPATSEPSTPAQKPEATPASNVAQPTGWRGHVIESKNAEINGKLLGDLELAEIQGIKTGYLDKIPDPSRMTLAQKKLAAMVGMALAELNPSTDLPPAANVEEQSGLPEHTVQLLDAIESSQLNRNDFMKICRENSYISATATRPEDITEAEFVALSREWPTIVADVKKAQP